MSIHDLTEEQWQKLYGTPATVPKIPLSESARYQSEWDHRGGRWGYTVDSNDKIQSTYKGGEK